MELSITGKVIRGDKYGRKIGFPTANIDRREFVRRRLKIRLGVYAGSVTLPLKRLYKAGIIIGPLDKRQLPKLEAHLLNFKGNLYGKKITIVLTEYLRPFKKFKNEQALKLQIRKDLNIIKNY